MESKTTLMRNDRERAAREAADLLLSAIAMLESASLALEEACAPALVHRTRTLEATAERVQVEVARVIGDIVRERVVEEYARRPESRKPKLYIA